MIYLIYILTVCTAICAIGTSVLYHFDKYRLAKDVKMFAATFFVALGALCCARAQSNIGACAVIFAGFIPAYFGDYFLAKKEYPIQENKDDFYFRCGVCSFGIAQIMYFVGFIYSADWTLSPYFIPLCFYSLIPTLGGMAIGMVSVSKKKAPVMMVYGLLLSFTLFTSASLYYLYPSTSSMLAMLGAICFCLSDSVLGIYYFGKVNINKKLLNYPVMILYFAAQILYAYSMLYA